jgi:hypothetical protein
MDKLTIIIETSAIGLALIVFGIIILSWIDFSDAINLVGQSRFIVGGLCLILGFFILGIDKVEAKTLKD